MFSQTILDAVRSLTDACLAKQTRMTFAESCTGGLIAGAMTELAGSSRVVDCGFVVYSNLAKTEMLGVPASLVETHGAVSEPVAIAMSEGALRKAGVNAQLSIAVTGVAGPDASEAKPVGLVHISVARTGHPTLHEKHQFGPLSRTQVRERTVIAALALALKSLG